MLNQVMPVRMDTVGGPRVEAIRVASLMPARVIGMDDRLGQPGIGQGRRCSAR